MKTCLMKCLRKESGFMDNIKGDNYFAEKLKADLAFIVKHTVNTSKGELMLPLICLALSGYLFGSPTACLKKSDPTMFLQYLILLLTMLFTCWT